MNAIAPNTVRVRNFRCIDGAVAHQPVHGEPDCDLVIEDLDNYAVAPVITTCTCYASRTSSAVRAA